MAQTCPKCGESNRDEATTCTACGATLAAADLVPVLGTTEAGLLPVITAALEGAGIEFVVHNRGLSDAIMGHRSSMSVGETDTPLQILVRPEDEARASAILNDLEAPVVAVDEPAPVPEARPLGGGAGPIRLVDGESGAEIGRVTEAQFRSLADHLEIESIDDRDYYLDRATLAMLQDRGTDPPVVELLRVALGAREGMDVRWSRTGAPDR